MCQSSTIDCRCLIGRWCLISTVYYLSVSLAFPRNSLKTSMKHRNRRERLAGLFFGLWADRTGLALKIGLRLCRVDTAVQVTVLKRQIVPFRNDSFPCNLESKFWTLNKFKRRTKEEQNVFSLLRGPAFGRLRPNFEPPTHLEQKQQEGRFPSQDN